MDSSKKVPFFFAIYARTRYQVYGQNDRIRDEENSQFKLKSGIITVSNFGVLP